MEIGRFVLSCLKGENNVVGKTGSIQLVDDLHDRLKVQLGRKNEIFQRVFVELQSLVTKRCETL